MAYRRPSFGAYRLVALACTALAALGLADAAGAGPEGSARIVNGLVSHAFPTTGALLYAGAQPIDENNAGSWCSGTLIGCETFLTAAHCVDDDLTPSHYWVYLQHAGIVPVSSITHHPDYDDATFPIADVAVVKLAVPVTGIDPTPINETDPTPFIPTAGTIAGFGRTGGSTADYGIKRAGDVVTGNCPPNLPNGAGNDELVCWRFENPIGPPGDDSNTCNGDSGGPLFFDLGAGEVVGGVTSGGTNGSCLAGDNSYDANVFTYGSYVAGELGVDSTSTCGLLAAVGDPAVAVTGVAGTLGTGVPSAAFSVELPTNADELRFALNGEDNGAFNVNLFVKQGSGASPVDFDCAAAGTRNFGDCAFPSPTADEWSVFVQRGAGAGEYQVTATIFGGDPPVCGNHWREPGEACDGTDDSACAGLCQLDCMCPPPSCGNSVAEQGEQCDGTDTGACPTGVCDPDCTCEDPVCGNDVVEPGEQCDGTSDAACPGSCFPPFDASACQCDGCGNGVCDAGEDEVNCAPDCGCAAPGVCGGQAPATCYCDTLCASLGDCCPDVCTACAVCTPGCGNGIVETGEECDDGNTADDDCCTSGCFLNVPVGCGLAGNSSIQIVNNFGAARDQMKWRLARGSATSHGDWGTPDAATSYALCVFDRAAATPSLAATLMVPASSSWTEKPAKGWRYKDSTGSADGVRSMKLKTGGAGRSKISIHAKGVSFPTPGPVDAQQYFAIDPTVTVQLVNSAGECWTSDFADPTNNSGGRFKAKFP